MKIAKVQLVVQGILLAVWLAMSVPTMLLWRNSIPWMQFMTVFTIVESAASGVAAAWGRGRVGEEDGGRVARSRLACRRPT